MGGVMPLARSDVVQSSAPAGRCMSYFYHVDPAGPQRKHQSPIDFQTWRQNTSFAPSWMVRGGVTSPFHSPNVGLATSVSNP
jgi:hypothetical protein